MEEEKREGEPPKNVLMVVDWIRHGKPSYTEEEQASFQLEGTLTEEGHRQAREAAINLLKKIRPENEVIIFWVSPKNRARETATDIEEVLRENQIILLERKNKGTVGSLRDVTINEEFAEELDQKGLLKDGLESWRETENLPGGVEKPSKVHERTMRVLSFLAKIAQTITPPEGKVFHFIVVGHEEIISDIIDHSFGEGEKIGPDYGESMRMEILEGGNISNVRLDFEYRGVRTSSNFDVTKRQIIPNLRPLST